MNVEANKAIGAALRTMRKETLLTQVDLALKLGKPQSYVSKIEMGERALQVCELPEYANALKMTTEEVVQRLFGDR